METPSEDTTPKRHSRHSSSGRALPRRPTRGPLDMADAPITPSSPTTTTTAPLTPKLTKAPSSLLSPTTSQYRTPRLPSPGPGSNLSTMSTSPSFRTAKTSLSPSRSNMSFLTSEPSTTGITTKDFSFLLRPEIYHSLTLLDVPPPFRVTASQIDPSTPLPTLLSTGHFRAAAIKAASLLTSSPPISPSSHAEIFNLVYTRLASLTLCNQTALAAQEVKALEDLNSGYYRDEITGSHLVLWELRVLAVRLQGMGFNDARRGVVGYYDLAREARATLTNLKKSRAERKIGSEDNGDYEELDNDIKLWQHRLSDLGIRVASALIEMEDLEGATRFLTTLKPDPSSSDSASRLEIQKALLWLCIGDVDAARACVAETSGGGNGSERDVILALSAMADGDFDKAVEIWRGLIDSEGEEGEKAMWRQNLGVCYLYLGRMDDARTILESLISTSHSFHALTFNLSTIYELCTERSRALKIGLAEKVAGMRDEHEDNQENATGWEKVNGDFKL